MLCVEEYHTRYRLWIVVLYLHCFYFTFAIFVTIGIYFIITNLIVNMKQRHLIFLLRKSMRHRFAYENLNLMLKRTLRHTKEMNAYNAFYSKYITITISCYCFLGSFMLNCTISMPSSQWIVMIFWSFLSVLYLLCIVLICVISSKTTVLNDRIFLNLNALKLLLCKREILARNILHLELVNEYKTLLHSTSFRIVTQTPLDNKFYLFQLSRYIFMIYFKLIHIHKNNISKVQIIKIYFNSQII